MSKTFTIRDAELAKLRKLRDEFAQRAKAGAQRRKALERVINSEAQLALWAPKEWLHRK